MANKPTFKQTARIWSHCAAYGSGNVDWAKLGREGGLSKHVASDIIGLQSRHGKRNASH
jgi:hypothetical protein